MLTLSDHCPLTAVLEVNVNTVIDHSDYEFITKPPKLSWNSDISYRFENILQTPGFASRFEAYSNNLFSCDQSGIDQATNELSNLLIEGAMRSDHSVQHDSLVRPTLGKCSKKRKKYAEATQNGMICLVLMHTEAYCCHQNC